MSEAIAKFKADDVVRVIDKTSPFEGWVVQVAELVPEHFGEAVCAWRYRVTYYHATGIQFELTFNEQQLEAGDG